MNLFGGKKKLYLLLGCMYCLFNQTVIIDLMPCYCRAQIITHNKKCWSPVPLTGCFWTGGGNWIKHKDMDALDILRARGKPTGLQV